MNSQDELSIASNLSVISDAGSFELPQLKQSTITKSQFLNYRQITQKMKEKEKFEIIQVESKEIMILCITDDEMQESTESDDSYSFKQRFNESWIRIV